MSRLFWTAPRWAHTALAHLTGWRLRVHRDKESGDTIKFTWYHRWP